MATNISDSIQITQINASLSRGGWAAKLVSFNDTDILAVHQKITIPWRSLFGGTSGILRTAFEGYVQPTRFQFDSASALTEYIAETSDGFLRKGWLQGLGLADVSPGARENYHQWDDNTGAGPPDPEVMTMGRIVRHILGFYDELGAPPPPPPPPAPPVGYTWPTNPAWLAHTNLVYHPTQNPSGWVNIDNVETMPFDAVTDPNGTMKVTRYIVRETTNIWSRLQEIAKNEFFVVYCDKNDNLYYTKHPMYKDVIPPVVMTFDKDFVVGPPVVDVRDENTIRQVRLHAVQDDGSTIHSNYPVVPTHVYGNIADITYIRCNDQPTLDDWAEKYYLFENRPYTVRWTAPGLSGLMFEILDRIEITYAGTSANGVHIDWAREKFWIHEINVMPGEGFGGTTEFILEAENL